MLKSLATIVALSLALSCTPSKVDWPELAKCGPQVSDLIGTVSRILIDGTDWQDELADLARTHGSETVICIVDRLRQDWGAPGAARDAKVDAALARANAFLADTGTNVERD